MAEALLEVRDLHVGYRRGGLGLRGPSLRVEEGEIVAVLGANAAGKTTLIRAATGTLGLYGGRVVEGEVRFDGRDVAAMRREDVARVGAIQVPEGRRVLAHLSVEDNLRAGAVGAGRRRNDDKPLEQVFELFPVLAERRHQPAGFLSGGEQQMLAIGRALCGYPKLLLLDEPTMGLSPVMVHHVLEAVLELHRLGVSILLAEQQASSALEIADRAYVLRQGELVGEGEARVLRDDTELVAGYLGTGGTAAAASATRAPRKTGPVRLAVRDLSISFGAVRALDGVSFEVPGGSVTALIGPNGAGKSTLLNCVTGVFRHGGSVTIDGRERGKAGPEQVARMGVGRTFQHVEAPPNARVIDVVLLGRHRVIGGGLVRAGLGLARREEARHRAAALELLERFGLREFADEPMERCPYGIQKRVDLARALALDPDVLLLDEPFAGLSTAEAVQVMDGAVHAAAERNAAVLLVDHNVEVVLAHADRAIVLDYGRQIAEGTPAEVSADPVVVRAYLGDPGERERLRHDAERVAAQVHEEER